MQFTREQFVDLVKAIYDEEDTVKQLYGLIGVRKLLSLKENQPIQQVIDAGLVPRLIEYASSKNMPQMQL